MNNKILELKKIIEKNLIDLEIDKETLSNKSFYLLKKEILNLSIEEFNNLLKFFNKEKFLISLINKKDKELNKYIFNYLKNKSLLKEYLINNLENFYILFEFIKNKIVYLKYIFEFSENSEIFTYKIKKKEVLLYFFNIIFEEITEAEFFYLIEKKQNFLNIIVLLYCLYIKDIKNYKKYNNILAYLFLVNLNNFHYTFSKQTINYLIKENEITMKENIEYIFKDLKKIIKDNKIFFDTKEEILEKKNILSNNFAYLYNLFLLTLIETSDKIILNKENLLNLKHMKNIYYKIFKNLELEINILIYILLKLNLDKNTKNILIANLINVILKLDIENNNISLQKIKLVFNILKENKRFIIEYLKKQNIYNIFQSKINKLKKKGN